MDWIDLTQERDSSCECSNDSPISKKCRGIFWLADDMLTSQEGPFPMELVMG